MENQPTTEDSSALEPLKKVLEVRDILHREIYRQHGLDPKLCRVPQSWPSASTLPEGVVQLGEVVEYYLFTISKAWAFTQGAGTDEKPTGVINGKAGG